MLLEADDYCVPAEESASTKITHQVRSMLTATELPQIRLAAISDQPPPVAARHVDPDMEVFILEEARCLFNRINVRGEIAVSYDALKEYVLQVYATVDRQDHFDE